VHRFGKSLLFHCAGRDGRYDGDGGGRLNNVCGVWRRAEVHVFKIHAGNSACWERQNEEGRIDLDCKRWEEARERGRKRKRARECTKYEG